MLFHFLLGLLVAAEQIVRGLCVCSFGLRTIAVLMSLFPSLGISSFRTAVCCDGENEYTTPTRDCQQDFAFFLIFFADFFWRGGGHPSTGCLKLRSGGRNRTAMSCWRGFCLRSKARQGLKGRCEKKLPPCIFFTQVFLQKLAKSFLLTKDAPSLAPLIQHTRNPGKPVKNGKC